MASASGDGREEPRRRGWLRLLFVGLPLLMLAWIGVCVWQMQAARSELLDGADLLERVRATRPEALLANPGRWLDPAQAKFERAEDRVQSPLLAPLRPLPIIGRQLRSVRALTASAHRVSVIGKRALERAHAVVEDAGGAGPDRVDAFRSLEEIGRQAGEDLSGLDLGPSKALIGTLDDARDRFVRELGKAQRLADQITSAAGGLADFFTGPRTYLVFAANNAEMRAGAGMPLSYGVGRTGGGRFLVDKMQSIGALPLPKQPVVVDEDLQTIWAAFAPGTTWVNANLTARFPAAAAHLSSMWAAVGGERVDGVLFLDPVALAAILSGTGPVRVAGGSVSAGAVVGDLLHNQYREANVAARRDRLSEIAQAVVGGLDGNVDLLRLGTELQKAARGRHVLAWATADVEQSVWARLGVDGGLQENSLMVSLINRGQNKLDPHMQIDVELRRSAEAGSGAGQATLELRVRNRATGSEPPLVLGPYEKLGLAKGTYAGILTVNLPGTASMVAEEGGFRPVGGDGPTVAAVLPVQVPAGSERVVTLRFRLPRNSTVRVEAVARVPTARWRLGTERWNANRPKTVSFL